MFCTNCGSKVSDDAVFCAYCGFKLQKSDVTGNIVIDNIVTENNVDENTVDKNNVDTNIANENAISESAVSEIAAENEENEVANTAAMPAAANEDEVVPVNITVQPVPDLNAAEELPKQTEKIEEGEQPDGFIPQENHQYVQMQQPQQQPQDTQMQQNTQQQNLQQPQDTWMMPQAGVKVRRNIIGFSIASVIFALLTIAASVLEMLDASSEISDFVRLIEVSITSVILIIYAFSNDRTVFTLKGIAVAITIIADIIFVGVSSIKFCIESFTESFAVRRFAFMYDVDEWVIMTFLISMLVWFGAMYIFFLIDAIRGFAGARGIKTFTLIFGFAAVLGVAVNMIFRVIVVKDEFKLYYDIVPMNLEYVFFILSMCFGIMAKKRIKK